MTQKQAEEQIGIYAEVGRQHGLPSTISEIDSRYAALDSPPIDKTMRWLGFCQGYLVANGVFTLDDVKRHTSRFK